MLDFLLVWRHWPAPKRRFVPTGQAAPLFRGTHAPVHICQGACHEGADQDDCIGERRDGRKEMGADRRRGSRCGRSEEHTSELQSLMRISYAVFCLKKKKPTKTKNSQQQYKS